VPVNAGKASREKKILEEESIGPAGGMSKVREAGHSSSRGELYPFLKDHGTSFSWKGEKGKKRRSRKRRRKRREEGGSQGRHREENRL